MSVRLCALALAPAAIATPAFGTTYFSVAQVQALLFPNIRLVDEARTLTPEQAKAIRAQSGVDLLTKQVKFWRAPDGSGLFVDEVIGKHEYIIYAVALDASGAVRDVEIMTYNETYGGGVRDARWRAQFAGKRAAALPALGKDIKNISGGTLSSRHVTDGVRRLLATYQLVYAHA